jgi:hypothetical protein
MPGASPPLVITPIRLFCPPTYALSSALGVSIAEVAYQTVCKQKKGVFGRWVVVGQAVRYDVKLP